MVAAFSSSQVLPVAFSTIQFHSATVPVSRGRTGVDVDYSTLLAPSGFFQVVVGA